MRALLQSRSFRRWAVANLFARLPLTMQLLALVLAGEAATGSLAVGAQLAGAATVATGAAGLWRGRQLDRRDLRSGLQRHLLAGAAGMAGIAVAVALEAPVPVLFGVAIATAIVSAAVLGGFRALLVPAIGRDQLAAGQRAGRGVRRGGLRVGTGAGRRPRARGRPRGGARGHGCRTGGRGGAHPRSADPRGPRGGAGRDLAAAHARCPQPLRVLAAGRGAARASWTRPCRPGSPSSAWTPRWPDRCWRSPRPAAGSPGLIAAATHKDPLRRPRILGAALFAAFALLILPVSVGRQRRRPGGRALRAGHADRAAQRAGVAGHAAHAPARPPR